MRKPSFTYDDNRGITAYRFDREVLERLLATLNSYLAHLAKADSYRLLSTLLDENHWLTHYFRIDGHKATRTWQPPKSFRRVGDQWRWFRHGQPEAAVFFQVGPTSSCTARTLPGPPRPSVSRC